MGIKGSIEECFVRKSVAERLLLVAKSLAPYKMLILDAWRPLEVQQTLFDDYKEKLRSENTSLDEESLLKLTQTFVSLPSSDQLKPSPHYTGGSVDLTIINEKGQRLPMGSGFDSFSEEDRTDYFERNNLSSEELVFRDNRRLHYNAMIENGFSNYMHEWWHFDFGNQFWSKVTGNEAIYNGKSPI